MPHGSATAVHPWYFSVLTYAEAEQRILSGPPRDGTFLVWANSKEDESNDKCAILIITHSSHFSTSTAPTLKNEGQLVYSGDPASCLLGFPSYLAWRLFIPRRHDAREIDPVLFCWRRECFVPPPLFPFLFLSLLITASWIALG